MAAKKKSADTDPPVDAAPELPMETVEVQGSASDALEAAPEADKPEPSLGVVAQPKVLPSLDQCQPVTHEDAMRELREANKARALAGESLAPPSSHEQALIRQARLQTICNELAHAKQAATTGKDPIPHIERALGLVRQ